MEPVIAAVILSFFLAGGAAAIWWRRSVVVEKPVYRPKGGHRKRSAAESYDDLMLDDEFSAFLAETEWFQPFMNKKVFNNMGLPQDAWVDEKPSSWVNSELTSSKYLWRTYELFGERHGIDDAIKIGEIFIEPLRGPWGEPNDSKAITIKFRFNQEIQRFGGGFVHECIRAVVNLANSNRDPDNNYRPLDADSFASRRIAEAAWDSAINANPHAPEIGFNCSGPCDDYFLTKRVWEIEERKPWDDPLLGWRY